MWCGVVWCGVVWCGVVWCGVVWCGVVWCGVVWCGVVWCGVVWCGVVWCGVVWCDVSIATATYQSCLSRAVSHHSAGRMPPWCCSVIGTDVCPWFHAAIDGVTARDVGGCGAIGRSTRRITTSWFSRGAVAMAIARVANCIVDTLQWEGQQRR